MTSRRLLLLPAVAVLVAACSSVGSTPGAASDEPSSAPSAAAQTRIAVTLNDNLKMDPASMTVPMGVPVTFVVRNAGAVQHEFYLGDDAAQAEHEQEMMSMGGMRHDEPEGIGLAPGETKELTYTFATAGQVIAGCHEDGHYGGGMKAAITVTE